MTTNGPKPLLAERFHFDPFVPFGNLIISLVSAQIVRQ